MKSQLFLLFFVLSALTACSYKAQLLGAGSHPSLDLSTKPTNATMTVYSSKAWLQDATPSLTLFGPFEAQKIIIYKSADCSGPVLTEKTLSGAVSNYVDVPVPALTAGVHRFSARLRLNDAEQSECVVMNEPYIYNPAAGATYIRQGSGEMLSLKSDGSVALWGDLSQAESIMASMPFLTANVVKLIDGFPGALKADGSLVFWGQLPPQDPDVDLSKEVVDFAGSSDDYSIVKANGDVWTWGFNFGSETKMATNTRKVYFNGSAFAALKNDGSVEAWGEPSSGGDTSTVAVNLTANVVSIVTKTDSFVAIKSDGSVVAWGDATSGGDSSTVSGAINSGVVSVIGNDSAYAALKNDGSVFAWGDSDYGGDTSLAAADLASGVSQIIPVSRVGFAALKTNGAVITWGDSDLDIDSGMAAELSSGVVKIVANRSAIAALKSDGSVLSWGNSADIGGWATVEPQLSSNVIDIIAGEKQFFALKSDGSVIGWGARREIPAGSEAETALATGVTRIITDRGALFTAFKNDGTLFSWNENYQEIKELPANERLASKPVSAAVSVRAAAFVLEDGSVVFKGYGEILNTTGVASQLTLGVKRIYANESAAVAIKENGAAVVWGGGLAADTSAVASRLNSGVDKVYHTQTAFAALKTDGSVVVWGESTEGGDTSSVAASLTSGVVKIAATKRAFAALKSDGSVIVWGHSSYGADASLVAAQIASGVKDIVANSRDFAAIKNDGTVVTWGVGDSGDSSSVAADLVNVVNIVGNTSDFNAFAALRSDGSVVAWGDPFSGGDVSLFAAKVSSDVISITPFESGFAAMKNDGRVVIWQFPTAEPTEVADVENVSNGGAYAVVRKKDGSIMSSAGLQYGEPYSQFLGAGGVEALTVNGGLFYIRKDGTLIGKIPQYRLEL